MLLTTVSGRGMEETLAKTSEDLLIHREKYHRSRCVAIRVATFAGNHLPRARHTKAGISAAIERLRKRNPSAMITVEYFAVSAGELDMFENEMREDAYEVLLLNDEEDDEEAIYISENTLDLNKSEEILLENTASVHGNTYRDVKSRAYAMMKSELYIREQIMFRGIYIDTCANRSSVISYAQYKSCCAEFQVPCNINKEEARTLRGLRGKSSSIGAAIIPVPFKDLNLGLDVKFQIF